MKRIKPLYILISMYFFFGFIAASNNILVPAFKKSFSLTQTQSQLVETAFFLAYFVGSILYFLYTMIKGDLLNKIGYKKGLIIGLSISAFGSLVYIPAVYFSNFNIFLVGLFIIGLGFSLQQIILNPYIIALGSKDTGAHRINIAGSLNSIATMIAPLILGRLLFGNSQIINQVSLTNLYPVSLIIFSFFCLAIYVVKSSQLPELKNEEVKIKNFNIFKYPELILGVIAIFVYVGIEVSIGSNLTELLKQNNSMTEKTASIWVSLYWGSLMIGRWAGSTDVFFLNHKYKNLIKFIVPFIAFLFILIINIILSHPTEELYIYFAFVLVASISYIIAGNKARNNLTLMTGIGIVFYFIALGSFTNYSHLFIVSGGLFLSVLWPCIFEIAIKRLGTYTNIGSTILIMMIIGGAILPVLQANFSSQVGMLQSYWIPLGGFVYLFIYGIYSKMMKL